MLSASTLAQINALCDAGNMCTVNRAVTPGVNAQLSLTWRGQAVVERNSVLNSEGGRFMLATGTELGSHVVPLRQTLFASPIGGPVDFSLRESLNVPASISRRAAQLGAQQIHYERMFTLEGFRITATQIISLKPPSPNSATSIPLDSEPGSTALTLQHLSLRFNTGAQVATIGQNQALRVEATLNYDGAGMLDAVWEAAALSTSSDMPIYRPLRNVRQYLGGSRQAIIQSPLLPNDTLGVYIVRLRVQAPTLGQEQNSLSLRYQVSQRQVDEEPAFNIIEVLSPTPSFSLTTKTAFSWRAIAGTQAYQIEFFEQPPTLNSKPVTGILLNKDTTSSFLTQSVFNYLQPGKVYYWQIIAIDKQGQTFAKSEVRDIKM